ncbi:hypothetical protein GA0070616_4363 [Micromonospora nigra]|uniref:Phage protein, HK97 gp10 family n=1 Tax=Micromonospora nigra TaxID=145857 RepID=A0A1C6SQT2_9ACTN|nr:HK97 gp10 family phage protein [Micromonospora nigra]SCL31954.1 hypothetical protein GA0070616_4363 [Micromonospora nigra]
MPAVGRDAFGRVVVDLRQIPRDVRRDLRPALKAVGERVAQDARGRASWSSRIPRAIKVKVLYGRGAQGVVITVNRKKAPHARPYEGITGSNVFRHPFFGNRDRWYAQRTRPFLEPAAQAKRAAVREEIVKVVEAAARRHGFN